MNDLLRYNEDQKYVCFDFETCSANLQSPTNLPWQLGLILCQGTKILERKCFYLKWNPLPMTEGAARVTKFNFRKYQELATDPAPILEYLESYLYNPEYLVMYHNGLGFDSYVHNIYRRKLGKQKPDWSYLSRVIDTHALAKGIKEGLPYRKEDNFLVYQYKLLSIIKKGLKTNLTLLGKENSIEFDYDTLHDGLNDVILMKLVWDKWIKWNVEI